MKTIRNLVARTAVLSAVVGTAVVLGAGTAHADAGTATVAPATYAGDWAAIAVSIRTGNVAYAHGYASAAAAGSSAVSRCNAYDCRAVVQVTNGCGAIAQASNRAWGWGYAASRAGAERQAVSGAPGRGARIIAYVCASNHL